MNSFHNEAIGFFFLNLPTPSSHSTALGLTQSLIERSTRNIPGRKRGRRVKAGAATFLSSSSSFILTKADWIPFQTHCYSENLVAPGIELGTSELAARNSDHYTTEAVSATTITFLKENVLRVIYFMLRLQRFIWSRSLCT
jgi:hypothetical protein